MSGYVDPEGARIVGACAFLRANGVRAFPVISGLVLPHRVKLRGFGYHMLTHVSGFSGRLAPVDVALFDGDIASSLPMDVGSPDGILRRMRRATVPDDFRDPLMRGDGVSGAVGIVRSYAVAGRDLRFYPVHYCVVYLRQSERSIWGGYAKVFGLPSVR